MRTGVYVEDNEVLGVANLVSGKMIAVGNALRRLGWGRTGEKKPLLTLEATKDGTQLPNTYIKAQVNDHKRSCMAIFLDCLPASEREKIQECMYTSYVYIVAQRDCHVLVISIVRKQQSPTSNTTAPTGSRGK